MVCFPFPQLIDRLNPETQEATELMEMLDKVLQAKDVRYQTKAAPQCPLIIYFLDRNSPCQ